MSPEQLRGEPLDARSDLFSLGAVLYEMLAGEPAFRGATAADLVHAVLAEQPPALTGSPAVAAVNRVLLEALAKRRDDRPPDAPTMARALERALALAGAEAKVEARTLQRLIVLPFRLLRPDPEIDFLGAALAEAVTGSLASLGSLAVRSSLLAARFTEPQPDLQAPGEPKRTSTWRWSGRCCARGTRSGSPASWSRSPRAHSSAPARRRARSATSSRSRTRSPSGWWQPSSCRSPSASAAP